MARPIILLDQNAPWVVSLFRAVAAAGTPVRALRVHSMGYRFGSAVRGWGGPWHQTAENYFEKDAVVAGWTRFHRLSTLLATTAVRRCVRRHGKPLAVVYTLPQYASVAERLAGDGLAGVYYAHDPFRFYGWDPVRTSELERRMVRACELTFAVARQLCDDLAVNARGPVIYSPNAAGRAFVDQLGQQAQVPADVQSLPRPIVGCTGQINGSYDWDLIDGLSQRLPNATFVFVGPLLDESEAVRQRIAAVLARPNVRWLGKKPHDQLPAYWSAFDVCLNPLQVNEHNNRRSPLRLYDYLSTSKPILSTAVSEAYQHQGLVEIGQDVEQCAAALQQMLRGERPVDVERRRRYIRNNTWEQRAAAMLREISKLDSSAAGSQTMKDPA